MPDQGWAEKYQLDFIWYGKEVEMWYWCDLRGGEMEHCEGNKLEWTDACHMTKQKAQQK